ncbi:MAG: tyrosine--tRNA ligase [Acidimicrobiales bacterium]
MPSLLDDLRWRGLLHQTTDQDVLPARLDGGRLTAYIGFDPSSDSLHVGHLQQVCLLRRLQDHGHRPIALVGGGTGMIGDPSGKSEERNLLSAADLQSNTAGIAAQLDRFWDFGRDGGAILADNADWLAGAGLLDFLREVGKYFSVNEMVRKDSVRARLEEREEGLSFTEFSYTLLQAWDFVQLYDRHHCELQLGGSDQWGNIVEGVDLIRRLRGVQAFGMTSPLVTKADGSKFGKTEAGSVWLSEARTSRYDFYQFWLRTADAEVGSYLRRFTFLSHERIEDLEAATAARPERRDAQRCLAAEMTSMVHGSEEAARAERAAAVLFTEGVAGLDAATLQGALADAPTTRVSAGDLEAGLPLVEVLVRTGLAGSRGDARQLLAQGSVHVNGRRAPADASITSGDALHGRWVVVRRGKATQHVLAVEA